jgi:prepilin-type processing-associated H-X9-DG protein
MRTVSCSLRLFATAALVSLSADARAQAQAPARPESLARYFPSENLVAYAEFDGLDAHQEAWRKTAAYKLLNQTTTGVMLEQIITQVAARALPEGAEAKLSGKEFLTLVQHAFRRGFAFGIVRPPGESKPKLVGLVVRGAGKGEVRRIVSRLIDAGNAPNTKAEAVTKAGDRTVIVVADPRGQGFAWWTEGDDLAFSLITPAGADAMIAALNGKTPDARANQTRAALARSEAGFEPVGLGFFDMAALPKLPPQAASLGLDRIKRVDYRWGFQDDALMTVTRLIAPAPRSGILALLDQPTFDARRLPSLPPGQVSFTVMSLDPRRLFDAVADAARATDPNAPAAVAAIEQAVHDATGLGLREDILKHLGPRMVAYIVPTRINAPTNPLAGLAQGLAHVPKTTLLIEVDDAKAFGKVMDQLVERANAVLKSRPELNGAEFVPLKGKEKGYVLALPPAVAPLPAGMRPTFLLGPKFLVIGSTPDVARKALVLQDRAGLPIPEGPLSHALAGLPERLTFLSVSDTRESLMPELIANLPALVQMIGSGSFPMTPFRRPPFGPPRPPGAGNGFRLAIDPDEIPDPDALRAFLFPSSFAMTVDNEGFRFVSRESFPALNPTTAAPVAVALLLPAVQASRSAARRSQSVNNMKQIGLAMHNFLSSQGDRLPRDITDKEGKPLLSWRVSILPFIEQQALFNEFHMDEPWDSPHNKALLDKMPMTFAIPGAKAEPGMTFYRGFGGPSTLFDKSAENGVGLADITDGTSNTIAVVEAKEAVPWTKPDTEIPFDNKKPPAENGKSLLEQTGRHFPGGFNALFMDGSVRFIKATVNELVMSALLTRNGGEVISSDSF